MTTAIEVAIMIYIDLQEKPEMTTMKPEDLLALKLGFKFKNGKPDSKSFKEALFNTLIENIDNISSVENIEKAIKLYASNGIAQRNQKQSQATIEKIENAIVECLENDIPPTKTYLNKRYGINYDALKRYQEQNPDKLPK